MYERKVRAKEEMVELPAEPLAAGILPDDLTEMVEAAEPRKPTLGVGRGRGLEGLRQVPGARCLPTPNHASPRFTTPPHSSPIPSPLLTTPHHSPPRLTRLGCYGSEAEHRAGDGRSNVDARQIKSVDMRKAGGDKKIKIALRIRDASKSVDDILVKIQ